MKSLKFCAVAFVAGVGIAAATQYPVFETLGYLPEEVEKTEKLEEEEAMEAASLATESMSKLDESSHSPSGPTEDIDDANDKTNAEIASTSNLTNSKSDPPTGDKLTESNQPRAKETASKESQSSSKSKQQLVASDFQRGVFTHNGFELPYRMLAPNVYEGAKKEYPLLVLLHGAGERGSDNEAQLKHGAAQLQTWLKENEVEAFLLFPQCPKDDQWADHKWSETKHNMRSKPTKSMAALLGLLDKILKTEPVNRNRLYATGLSMGGYGVFDLVARRPDTFAAAAPLCGGTDSTPDSIDKLLATPFFVVHGSDDSVVDVQNSRDVVKALKEKGSNPIFIELAGVDHDCWSETFADDTLFNWMFTKRKTWPSSDSVIAKSNPEAMIPAEKSKASSSDTPAKSGSSEVADDDQKPNSKVAASKETNVAKEEAGNKAPEIRATSKMAKPKRVVVAKPPLKEISPQPKADESPKVAESEKAAAQNSEDMEKPKPSALDGKWYVARAVHAGRKVAFNKLKSMNLEIEGDKITITQGDKREVAKFESGAVRKIGETVFAELKITSSRGAKEIRGFYYFDDTELTMIWGAPGAERPDPTNSEELAKARILSLHSEM